MKHLFGLLALLAVGCSSRGLTTAGNVPNEKCPQTYRVKFETSQGSFVVEVHRDWSPKGADRFYNLVKTGFYDECRFFRVLPGFMVQFGINGDPAEQRRWRESPIGDDPRKESNRRGKITFATGGRDTRTSQVFINYGDNRRLDSMGFSPFGEIVEGMDVAEKINPRHREQPDQGEIQRRGNAYLNDAFPDLDYVKTARFVE